MGRRKKRTLVVTIVIAGGLVLALFAAGTLLRMNTDDLAFLPAVRSFAADTFQFRR